MTDLNGSDLPIVGQANVVIKAQLSDVPPNDDARCNMQDEANSTVDSYELAVPRSIRPLACAADRSPSLPTPMASWTM